MYSLIFSSSAKLIPDFIAVDHQHIIMLYICKVFFNVGPADCYFNTTIYQE